MLQDGDKLVLRGWAQGDGYRIGFDEVAGTIHPLNPFLSVLNEDDYGDSLLLPLAHRISGIGTWSDDQLGTKALNQLPQDWVGTWKGTIATDSPTTANFSLELTIQPTDDPDRYQWTMIYDGEAGQSIRPYHLVIKDRAKGDFVIDEGNGIELEARFFADTLRSTFRAGANFLAVTYRLTEGPSDRKLIFDLMSFEQGERKNDGMMMVESLSILNFQRGELQPAESSIHLDKGLNATWQKQTTDDYAGKQDDIFFLNPEKGWYVNGAGKIYRTDDGGATWQLKLHQPGTFFRCIAFLDENVGVAGNIGPAISRMCQTRTPSIAPPTGVSIGPRSNWMRRPRSPASVPSKSCNANTSMLESWISDLASSLPDVSAGQLAASIRMIWGSLGRSCHWMIEPRWSWISISSTKSTD